jgi:hypothetical protein
MLFCNKSDEIGLLTCDDIKKLSRKEADLSYVSLGSESVELCVAATVAIVTMTSTLLLFRHSGST